MKKRTQNIIVDCLCIVIMLLIIAIYAKYLNYW